MCPYPVPVCVPCAQVVDALSRHFLSFGADSRVMPVIWHASLLVFVQRYKHQLTAADRDALLQLTTQQHHYGVSAGCNTGIAVAYMKGFHQCGKHFNDKEGRCCAEWCVVGAALACVPAEPYDCIQSLRHDCSTCSQNTKHVLLLLWVCRSVLRLRGSWRLQCRVTHAQQQQQQALAATKQQQQ